MTKNVGTVDRVIRVIAAVGVGFAIVTGAIEGPAAIILSVLAAVFVITAFISWCPIWAMLGIRTRRLES
jgi:predicted ABC-type sugar transport system permease subunit